MIESSIRNFKSFGNTEQVIKFSENGGLVLLAAPNGSGKTAIIEALDYCLFKKVKAKFKKTQTLTTLPNRINKEMVVREVFKTDRGELVEVTRGMNPSKLEIVKDGFKFDQAGASAFDAKIEKLVGMDFETYKSFISMSINDFKNFINLKPEEKRLLLDKLFNLEVINELAKILSSLESANKKDILVIEKEISTLEYSISSIKTSIANTTKKMELNLTSEIEEIKEYMSAQKPNFEALKEKIVKIEAKKLEIETQLEEYKTSYTTTNVNVKSLVEKIALYDRGVCPTCESDLKTSLSIQVKEGYITQQNQLEEIKAQLTVDIKKYMAMNDKIKSIHSESNSELSNLKYDLSNKKQRYENLLLQQSNLGSNHKEELEEFYKSLETFESDKTVKVSEKDTAEAKKLVHKELAKVFSETGVKRMIIRNIIDPINHFIQYNLEKMNIRFQIELDEDFSAKVMEYGEEIDPETMSTGETKKVNLAVMIAYLKMIRSKKMVNVLFLDEVFSGIDVDSIDDILVMLKDFANEYRINIILVHHSHMDSKHFDRIIRVKKEFFSTIEEEVLSV